MKKTLLLFPVALLALVGCDNKAANESSNSSESSGGETSAEHLEISREQARANLVAKGQDGIELMYTSQTDEGEPSSVLIGMKGEYIWTGNSEETFLHPMAVRYEPDTHLITQYYWNETDYTAIPMEDTHGTNEAQFNNMIDSVTQLLYLGHTMDNEEFKLVKDGSTTFLGRNAKKYRYEFNYPGVSAYYEVLIDAEIGITLSCEVAGATVDDSGWASLEVTSIKLGDDVINPTFA